MKKLLFFSILLSSGCANEKAKEVNVAHVAELSSEEKTKQNIERQISEFVKKNADDPSSYQRLETRITDTIYLADNLDKVLEFHESSIKDRKELDLNVDKKTIDQVIIIRAKIDSLKKAPAPNPIFGYRFEHECRIKNKLGALVKETLYIATDKDLKPIQIVTDKEETHAMYF